MKKSLIESVLNFRDLGGIKTKDNKTVKHGFLYRSGHLSRLTEEDLKKLYSLNISVVFDYRRPNEVLMEKDNIGDLNYRNIPVRDEANKWYKSKELYELYKNAPEEFYLRSYKDFYNQYTMTVFHNPAYKETFEYLKSHKPFLFHCAGGKDRTGVMAMMILLCLGVQKEEVVKDYMDTDNYTRDVYNRIVERRIKEGISEAGLKTLKMYLFVQEELINASIDSIFSKYNTIEDFMFSEYEITKEDIEDWKKFYLE